MNRNIITVSGLSKRYFIGAQTPHRTAREIITSGFLSPFRRMKGLIKGNAGAAADLKEAIWALKNVSFVVEEGEALGIIGHNGSGKSTLLKILSRITEPTEGQAVIRGRLASLLEVGTGFHPELTGRENIFLNGSILGMAYQEIRAKLDEIVAFAGIEKFLDTPVKHYSSGMYVRLAFSVAAHLEPEILIIDEVLAVGDIRFQKKCLGKMREVAHSGRTVLFVSHNLSAINSLCDKALLLSHGEMQRFGSTKEVVGTYLAMCSTVGSSRFWEKDDRPGNDALRFLSVEVLSVERELAHQVKLSEDTIIRIAYEVLNEGVRPCFSLMLYAEDGTYVFSSMSNNEPHFHGRPLSKGGYEAECRIYGHLLNAGRYWIDLLVWFGDGYNSFKAESVVSIDAVDDGVLAGDYHGRFGGCIRPKLDWEVRRKEPVCLTV